MKNALIGLLGTVFIAASHSDAGYAQTNSRRPPCYLASIPTELANTPMPREDDRLACFPQPDGTVICVCVGRGGRR